MKKIIEVLKIGSELQIVYDDGKKRTISVDAVNAGISWPTAISPSYFCIVGRSSMPGKNKERKLVLLSERQVDLPELLIEVAYNEARRFRCYNFFTDFSDDTLDYCRLFTRYLDSLNANFIELLQSEISDWNAGVLRIQKYSAEESLDIPQDSILRRQLGDIKAVDRENSQRFDFYAVNALRCCIGSFEIPVSYGRPVKPSSYQYL